MSATSAVMYAAVCLPTYLAKRGNYFLTGEEITRSPEMCYK